MNHIRVINSIAKETGVESELCEIIVKAFEKVAEEAVVHKCKGIENNDDIQIIKISEKTSVDPDTCKKVVDALHLVIEGGLLDKLGIFSRSRKK